MSKAVPSEIADKAMLAAGLKEIVCFQCDGAGEWDEGPLPATSSAQISPDYRQVMCPECKGSGRLALTQRWRCGNLKCDKIFEGPANNYPGPCTHCGFGGESLREEEHS